MEKTATQGDIPGSCLMQLPQSRQNEAERPFPEEPASKGTSVLRSRNDGMHSTPSTSPHSGSLTGNGRTVTVKRVTTSVFAAPSLAPTYIDVPVPVYVPRYIEVPVPVAKLDPQATQPLQQPHSQLLHGLDFTQQRECVQQLQQRHWACGRQPIQQRLAQRRVNSNERFIC